MEAVTTVKFGDFDYRRSDFESFESEFRERLRKFSDSSSVDEQLNLISELNSQRSEMESMFRLASIRYSINTKDEFYNGEHEYFDNIYPLYKGLINEYYKCLTESEYRDILEEKTGTQLFNLAEIELKTFSRNIVDDLKKENQLVTKYVKLLSSAKINFEGENRNLAGMDPLMQSDNREVRKKACEARWKFFEDKEQEIGEIYDELVKLRTGIAKKLGYKNFVQLGYDRLHRSGYSIDDIGQFRDHVLEYFVPVNKTLKENKRKELGYDKLYYYDAAINFKSGNPTPKGPPEWIVNQAKKMYEELSAETGEFINFMVDHDVLDLYNRENKSPGGYCSAIYKYKTPFIFANLNGTDHDVKVFTHEAGHAFQFYQSMNFEIPEYIHSTYEAAEIHSMSMEFITYPWMKMFFKEDTDKFLYSHLKRAVSFVPYGSAIDEFQHFVYENPDISHKERCRQWRIIEEKYIPDIDYAGNKFLENGGAWMQKHHIFKMPFYYIDYCLAQVCALQFWKKFNHDRDSSWNDYLNLCKEGGSKTFLNLLETAKLESPFEKKTIESVVDYAKKYLEENKVL